MPRHSSATALQRNGSLDPAHCGDGRPFGGGRRADGPTGSRYSLRPSGWGGQPRTIGFTDGLLPFGAASRTRSYRFRTAPIRPSGRTGAMRFRRSHLPSSPALGSSWPGLWPPVRRTWTRGRCLRAVTTQVLIGGVGIGCGSCSPRASLGRGWRVRFCERRRALWFGARSGTLRSPRQDIAPLRRVTRFGRLGRRLFGVRRLDDQRREATRRRQKRGIHSLLGGYGDCALELEQRGRRVPPFGSSFGRV